MAHVTSKDCTHIACSKTGQGEPLIIVNGAMGFREFYGDKPLASMLSEELYGLHLRPSRARQEYRQHR